MSLEERAKLVDLSSMDYWWPKIKDLDIPMPRTEILQLPRSDMLFILSDPPEKLDDATIKMLEKYNELMIETAKKVQNHPLDPIFIRTDQCSGKHDWKYTCFVEDIRKISVNFVRLLEFNELVGWMSFSPKSLVIREYIPMETAFEAFHGHMPINKERRYFIEGHNAVEAGKIICQHPYWPEESIEPAYQKKKELQEELDNLGMESKIEIVTPDDWRERLTELNKDSKEDLKILEAYALMVANTLEGYWSVDFSKGLDGKWYLIDMGHGAISYHDPECKKAIRFDERR